MNASPMVLKAGGRTVLAVPAEWTHVAWLELPARNGLQARAAARALLSTQLASPQDDLHVATAAHGDDAGHRLVVAVDRAAMRQWLDDARAGGIAPDVVVPDALLLPPPAPGDGRTVHVLADNDRWLVRGSGLAFAADAELAAMLVGDRPVVMVDPHADAGGTVEDVLARGALSPPVDLLQDAFAGSPVRSPRRRLRWLAVATLLVPLVMPAASAARHAWAAHVLDATARAEAAAALGAPVADPLVATDARREQLESGNALPRSVDALSMAVASRPGTSVDTLHYSAADGLVAGLDHAGPADLAALDASLAEAGLALAILEEGQAADGRRRSTLKLEAAR